MELSFLRILSLYFILIHFGPGNSVEYTALQADCTNDTPVVNYNINSLRQCLTLCLIVQCFYLNYTGSTCTRIGHNPQVKTDGHITLDAYRLMVWKILAGPDITATMSSTYTGDPQPDVASNAIDQDNSTLACTNNENNPWLVVDLKQNYHLQRLKFIIRSDLYTRFSSIKIYFSTTIVSPALYSTLTLYGSYPGSTTPISGLTYTSGKPVGPCGRYLVVQRTGTNVMLEVLDIDIWVI